MIAAPATAVTARQGEDDHRHLAETGIVNGETFTVALTDTKGTLTATGTGVTGSGTTA